MAFSASRSRWSSGWQVRLLCGRCPDRIPASYLCHVHVGNVTGCHAGCQEVNRYCTRDESEESIACRWQSKQVRDPHWLWNPGRVEVTNRVSVAPQKRLVSFKIFLKKSDFLYRWKGCLFWNHFIDHWYPGLGLFKTKVFWAARRLNHCLSSITGYLVNN